MVPRKKRKAARQRYPMVPPTVPNGLAPADRAMDVGSAAAVASPGPPCAALARTRPASRPLRAPGASAALVVRRLPRRRPRGGGHPTPRFDISSGSPFFDRFCVGVQYGHDTEIVVSVRHTPTYLDVKSSPLFPIKGEIVFGKCITEIWSQI